MDRYIGLDAHSASCTVAVVSGAGRKVSEQRVETHGQALRQLLRGIPGRKQLCFEEGELAEWLAEILQPHVQELWVVCPDKSRGPKSDALDAWKLAEQLRRGSIEQPVYKAPRKFPELRQAVRSYRMLQQDVVRSKNRLRAVVRARGVHTPASVLYDPQRRAEALAALPAPHRHTAELLGAELDAVSAVHQQAEQWLHEQARRCPQVQRLATAPGLGEIRAAQLVATLMTPWRFRSKRQLWNYSGLAVVTRVSSEWVRERDRWVRKKQPVPRGLNRNRQPVLKEVFVGAAETVIRQMADHPLHHDYQRKLADGMKPDRARLTLARRIAAAVLTMWKNQEDYDVGKHCGER